MDRRRFLQLGSGLAASSVLACDRLPQLLLTREIMGDSAPFAPPDVPYIDLVSHAISRLSYGAGPGEYARVRALGRTSHDAVAAYVREQLAPGQLDDGRAEAVLRRLSMLDLPVGELFEYEAPVVLDSLTRERLLRTTLSRRQLHEALVEFWSDHFNISYPQVNYLKLLDDRDVIRRHAFGKFPDLLKASAHSPAMLEYLDNTRNRQRTLNENYAREIMELHTMGSDGGYTQTDVSELARVLTGWTIAGRGTFNFDPAGHDFGAKTVLGQILPALPASAGVGGKTEGDQMLDILVKHPSTARYISKKMLRWLLQHEPSATQITAVAAVYTKTLGDIPSMVRAVLAPANVTAALPKFKRPYTFVLSTLRAIKPNVTKVSLTTNRYLTLLGQPMFYWDPPDGYPDRAEYWAGGVLQRWNFATYITTTSGELTMDINRFIAVNTPEGVVDAIGKELFGGEMPARLRGQLLTYLQVQPVPSQARVRETIALALSSSTFQWI